VLTSDMGRPYTDIIRYKGTWVMENWLHWAETFSPVVSHDVLRQSCPEAFQAWVHLRKAFLHYLCSHGWYEDYSFEEKLEVRGDARDHMRAYAKFVESEMGVQYCTLNLRLLVVHSFDQEFVTGPILHTLEFWIERAIQRYKKWIKDRVVKDPDIFLGQAYLLDLALRYESTRTRSVEEFFETAEVRTNADRKDDATLFAHFLDNGAHVSDFRSTFAGKLEKLRRFVQAHDAEMYSSLMESEDNIVVTTFKRAQVDLEVFSSMEYLRTSTRCSYHVCFANRETPANKFGRVALYFRMYDAVSKRTLRFCEMDCFRDVTTEADAELAYSVVRTSAPQSMFVALEDFRRKVMLFEPPACTVRNEARVLQCWTKGRV